MPQDNRFYDEHAKVIPFYIPEWYVDHVAQGILLELKELSMKKMKPSEKTAPRVSEKLRARFKKRDQARGRRMLFGK
jgi:hypothetical protein